MGVSSSSGYIATPLPIRDLGFQLRGSRRALPAEPAAPESNATDRLNHSIAILRAERIASSVLPSGLPL
jgi:hypothetical protein